MKVKITGSWDNFEVEGINFKALSPSGHKKIIEEGAPHNYSPISGWIVLGTGDDDCTLKIKRDTADGEEVKDVLDFQTMYSVHNFGYGLSHMAISQEIKDALENDVPAIPRAIDHLWHAPTLVAVKKFTGMDRVIMKSGGAEAVETACNIASQFWHQKNGYKKNLKNGPFFGALNECFHGRTRHARSLSSSSSSRDGFGPLISSVLHVPFGDIVSLKQLFATMGKLMAGFIAEPIQGEGGVNIPPSGYLKQVRELCTEYGVVLILDEIQTGFGRTGTDWACEFEGVKPDLLVAGKAAGGGILPVSFVAGTEEIMACIKPGTEGATWSAAPIQCIALICAIRELCDNDLSNESRRKGERFINFLNYLKTLFPESIVDVRGRGLFVGVETIHDGKKLSRALLEEGVWAKETGETGKTLRFSPPLTITEEQLFEAAQALKRALRRLEAENAQYGLNI